jgi:hypothetical protein
MYIVPVAGAQPVIDLTAGSLNNYSNIERSYDTLIGD